MPDSKTTNDRLLTTDEAAAMLAVSKATLETWRCVGRYNLPFIKMGKAIRYRVSDLEEFLRAHTVNATA